MGGGFGGGGRMGGGFGGGGRMGGGFGGRGIGRGFGHAGRAHAESRHFGHHRDRDHFRRRRFGFFDGDDYGYACNYYNYSSYYPCYQGWSSY